MKLVIGVPLTPNPVILYVVPDGWVWPKILAVVTYKISKFGPPNAADVICLTGNLISVSIFPVLGNLFKFTLQFKKNIFNLLWIDLNNGMTIESSNVQKSLRIDSHAIGQQFVPSFIGLQINDDP